MLPLRLFLT
jgi:hypothetical protein